MSKDTFKIAMLIFWGLVSNSYALTCPTGSTLETNSVDFIEALDQSTGSNLGTHTAGSLTTQGLTTHIGTSSINNAGASHGGAVAGVRFKIDSLGSLGNNSGTLTAPVVSLSNYQVVSYTFSQPVEIEDLVILKDLDGSSAEKYIDAATLLYEDASGNIVSPAATTVGSNLIAFSTSLAAQPTGLTLPASITGYAPQSYGGTGNTATSNWVDWNLTGVLVKRLIVVYWNNEPGATASGAQGISMTTPLTTGLCKANPVTPAPSIELIKSIGSVTDVNTNGIYDTGDIIHYTFKVNNTGNVDLTDIAITDTIAIVSGAPLSTLAVGASDTATFTAQYTITDADMQRGGVENRATVTAKDANGTSVTDISDTGTDPDINMITNPATSETDSITNVFSNNPSDPTDDPTVLLLGSSIVTTTPPSPTPPPSPSPTPPPSPTPTPTPNPIPVSVQSCSGTSVHLGGIFWVDINGNGIRDLNESIIVGATVGLFDENNQPIMDLDGYHTMETNEEGQYDFLVCSNTNYKVLFVMPQSYIDSYVFTVANATDDNLDSDVFATGLTDIIAVADTHIFSIDAGIKRGVQGSKSNNAHALNLFSMTFIFLLFLYIAQSVLRKESI